MSEHIKDGTGSGRLVKINANNEIKTNAVTTPANQQATLDGRSFNINTGVFTLTNDSDTPIVYFKCTESAGFHVDAIVVGFGTSTGGSATEHNLVTLVRNPTAGTIISSTPTDVDINSNRNFGSAATLSSLAYKGATGDTLTGGNDHILVFQPDFGRLYLGIDESIPNGSSMGIKVTPPTGNTSMDIYCAIIGYVLDTNR